MLKANQAFAYGYFHDEAAATAAVQELLGAGFYSEHIGALMLDKTGPKELPIKHKTAIGSGIAVGTLLGAAVGAVVLPGLGLMAFGGAFSYLAAAAAGGAAGSLAGVVGGMGIWRDEIDIPRQAFERGDVLVGVLVPNHQTERALQVLQQAGAKETLVSSRGEAAHELEHQHRAHTP